MLKEKVYFEEGLPLNCAVVQIQDCPIHFHEDLEVVFVIDGSVGLKNGYYSYVMKTGDVFILNDRELHSFHDTGEANMVLLLQVDSHYFGQYYENWKNNFFVADVTDEQDESLEYLRNILSRIALERLLRRDGYERRMIEHAHNLIDCLIDDFQYFAMEDGRFVNETKYKGNKILGGRLRRISDYMYDNYNRRLTLREIAEREHLSVYYLSHVFKETTGMSFQELLCFIRVEESEKLLLGTGKKIGAIAVESGFSAVRYYIKYFRKWFGMDPETYRCTYQTHVHGEKCTATLRTWPDADAIRKIRRFTQDAYEYSEQRRTTIMHEELEAQALPVSSAEAERALEDHPFRRYFKPVPSLLREFEKLSEKILLSGSNCLISAPLSGRRNASPECCTILLWNWNNHLPLPERDLPALLDFIKHYNRRLEIVVRLDGFSGNYRLLRSCLTRDSLISLLDSRRRHEDPLDRRARLRENWLETSLRTVEWLSAGDSLTIKAYLPGAAMEMILVDRQFDETAT